MKTGRLEKRERNPQFNPDNGLTTTRQGAKSAISMAKADLPLLTPHLAMELADHTIRVNAISPAVVDHAHR
jgi:NAD(P)-dependent dehydrogenase (short-subunit alcohol dehydrogenase family)